MTATISISMIKRHHLEDYAENHPVFHADQYQWFLMDMDLYETLLALREQGEISVDKALRRIIAHYQGQPEPLMPHEV